MLRQINLHILEIITCDPSIDTMGHPYLTLSNLVQKGLTNG